jgi:hypothetical protein
MPTTKQWPCRHAKNRTKLPGGKVHCGDCGKTFSSPKAKFRHGTNRGYQKHKRQRSGDWGWPLAAGTCGCREANQEYNRKIREIPENVELRHLRDSARQAALLQLRRQFPSEFQRHYVAEMIQRSGGRAADVTGDSVPVPLWDDLMAQLLKAALELDEASLHTKLRGGWATVRERTVLRLAGRLRFLLADADRHFK